MGMSASQARFLSLTARKTNVEYEGQQINQQRTSLSNNSSAYYSQLSNLSVPTPPTSEDYTKTVYTFSDGSETNTINSLIAQKDGWYILNYTQSYQTESVLSNGNIISTRKETGLDNPKYDYYVGSTKLRTLKDDAAYSQDEIDNDPYLSSLKDEPKQLERVLELEKAYLTMLQSKYKDSGDWMVRYQKNSSDNYEPVFYNKLQLETAEYSSKTGASLSGIKSYIYGQTIESREIKNAKARVEQDTSGRYKSIVIYETTEDGKEITTSYNLTASSQSDDAAYNDAMNKYIYDKSQYEQQIRAINAKIEVIQKQDKDLELKLKQLDTEEQALSTELEAVKKVVSNNVQSGFKTFNA